MSRESWLNFFTAIVYGLVFILSVTITTTVVLWANGSFRLYTEPADKIKFNVSEVVISENEGEANICVVSGQAVVDETGKVISDPAFREDIKLELWHINGVNKVEDKDKIVNITVESDEEDQDVDEPTADEPTDEESEGEDENQQPAPTTSNEPLVVELGKNINLKALLNTKDMFNIGGSCMLRAYTMNELYKAEIKIYVDVPVESISINAGDLNLEEVGATANEVEEESKEYTTFIPGDKFNLSVDVYPERALNSIKAIKTASFTVSESTDIVTLETIGDTTENTVAVDIIARNNWKGTITLTAKLPKYYQTSYNEYDDSQYVFTTVKIQVEELKLAEILINNNITESIQTSLFTNSVTKVSARDTGDSNITNLDLFLKPAFYNPKTNNDPLEYMINSRYIDLKLEMSEDSSNNNSINVIDPITIEAESIVENGAYNIIWTITANRVKLPGETISLVVETLEQTDEEEYITSNKQLDCDINYKTIEDHKLIRNGSNDAYEFNIVKQLNNNFNEESVVRGDNKYILSAPGREGLITIDSTVTDEAYSFTKLVFFITRTGTEQSLSQSNLNITGSAIINITESGQVQHQNVNNSELDLDQIQPMGQGVVSVTPYLVMTDKDGNPLGYDFNQLEDLIDVQGLIEYNSLGQSNDSDDFKNKYVVIETYNPITIKVTENLSTNGIRIFNSFDNIDDLKSDQQTALGKAEIDKSKIYRIAKGNANKVTLYIIGNSYLAMADTQNLSISTTGIEVSNIVYNDTQNLGGFGDYSFNYIELVLYVAEDSVANEVEFTIRAQNSIDGEVHLATMLLNVVDVGVKRVDWSKQSEAEPNAEPDNPSETSNVVSINKVENSDNYNLTLQPTVYTTNLNKIYNLQFTDSNGKQYLPLPILVPLDVMDIAIIEGEGEDAKIYSLYKLDTKLTPLMYDGDVKLFIADNDVILSNLQGAKAIGNNKQIQFQDNQGALITIFSPATAYAEIENNAILMKQPLPKNKQLVAVYMLLNEYNDIQVELNQPLTLTPMSMFSVTANFPKILPSVLAYSTPTRFDDASILKDYYVSIDEYNNLELSNDSLQPTNTTLTLASKYVTIDSTGLIKQIAQPTDTDTIYLYLLYLNTKLVETEIQYYISKVIPYTDGLNNTYINTITVNEQGGYSIPNAYTQALLSDATFYTVKDQTEGEPILNLTTPALLDTTVALSNDTYFSLSTKNLSISLNDAKNGGYSLTTTKPQNPLEVNTQVIFTITFQVVHSPTETDSRTKYETSISYNIQLPEGYYLQAN